MDNDVSCPECDGQYVTDGEWCSTCGDEWKRRLGNVRGENQPLPSVPEVLARTLFVLGGVTREQATRNASVIIDMLAEQGLEVVPIDPEFGSVNVFVEMAGEFLALDDDEAEELLKQNPSIGRPVARLLGYRCPDAPERLIPPGALSDPCGKDVAVYSDDGDG